MAYGANVFSNPFLLACTCDYAVILKRCEVQLGDVAGDNCHASIITTRGIVEASCTRKETRLVGSGTMISATTASGPDEGRVRVCGCTLFFSGSCLQMPRPLVPAGRTDRQYGSRYSTGYRHVSGRAHDRRFKNSTHNQLFKLPAEAESIWPTRRSPRHGQKRSPSWMTQPPKVCQVSYPYLRSFASNRR